MTKIKSIATKIILSILIILSFFMAQNTLFFSGINRAHYNEAWAETVIAESDRLDKSSDIPNNTFEPSSNSGSKTTTGSESVMPVKDWNKTGDVNSENMRAGVINIKDEVSFNKKCEDYLLDNSGAYPIGTTGTDNGNNVLFIRLSTATIFGFTSNEIELDANSYYAVSVKYCTGAGQASFGISSPDFTANNSTIIKHLESNGNWATATIYISTSDVKKTHITIGLYLGYPSWSTSGDSAEIQKGYVFFDEATLYKLSKSFYEQEIAKTPTLYNRVSVVDEQKHSNILGGNGFVQNGSFDSNIDNWTTEKTGASTVKVVDSESTEFVIQPKTNNKTADNKVLAIFNQKQENACGYAKTDPITLSLSKIYRFSIWAKTNASSVDFSVATKEEQIRETTINPATITEVSDAGDKTTNDWNEYVFFVTSSSLDEIEIVLTVGIKSNNSSNDEYLFVDNITSQLVSSEDLSNASNAKITYASLSLNPSTSLNIANGYFNDVDNITANGTYPLGVKNFERDDANKQNISGIVNLEETSFNNSKINFGNPSTKPNAYVYKNNSSSINENNNVLMMFNQTNSNQTTKSTSSLTASANTCYVLTVNVFTDIKNSLGGANIYLTDGTNTLAQICDINTQKTWGYYKIYFNNYGNELSLTAKLGFGRENKSAQGFAYFDNFEWNTYSSNVEDIAIDAQTIVVDLNKDVEHSSKVVLTESFDEYDVDEISLTNKLNAPLLWTGEVKASTLNDAEEVTYLSDQDITKGVLNINNSSKVIGTYNIMEDPTNSVLMIHSASDNFYGFSNKLNYNLTSGSYYRISVKVKTINLSQETDNQKTVDGKVVPYGASIYLDSYDEKFVGINTEGKFNNIGGWKTYHFYINPNEDVALKLWLCLGSENGWTSGYAFFDDVEIIEMTEDEFNLNLNQDKEDLNFKDCVLSVTTTASDDTPENNSSNKTYQESLAWLAIPTVLIALGIIAAIIGFLIKRYLDNRPVKVTVKNSYDRESTLLKDLDHKNYRTSVNHKLKLLREELLQAEQYLKEEQEEHSKQKEAYETAKEIAEQDKSIKLENPDKNYTSYEARIKKLEKNIASIKADIKILEDEQAKLNKKTKEMREKDLKGNEVKVTGKNKKK